MVPWSSALTCRVQTTEEVEALRKKGLPAERPVSMHRVITLDYMLNRQQQLKIEIPANR